MDTARVQELHLGTPRECRGSRILSISCCFAKHIDSKLDGKWNSQNLTQGQDAMPASYGAALAAMTQHWPVSSVFSNVRKSSECILNQGTLFFVWVLYILILISLAIYLLMWKSEKEGEKEAPSSDGFTLESPP